MAADDFIRAQMSTRLLPGETVLYSGRLHRNGSYLQQQLLALSCVVLVGLPLWIYLQWSGGWGPYYVVLTNQRFHFFWVFFLNDQIRGHHTLDVGAVRAVEVRRVVDTRRVFFQLTDGTERQFVLPGRFASVPATQTAFLEEMPARFDARQLPT